MLDDKFRQSGDGGQDSGGGVEDGELHGQIDDDFSAEPQNGNPAQHWGQGMVEQQEDFFGHPVFQPAAITLVGGGGASGINRGADAHQQTADAVDPIDGNQQEDEADQGDQIGRLHQADHEATSSGFADVSAEVEHQHSIGGSQCSARVVIIFAAAMGFHLARNGTVDVSQEGIDDVAVGQLAGSWNAQQPDQVVGAQIAVEHGAGQPDEELDRGEVLDEDQQLVGAPVVTPTSDPLIQPSFFW